MRRRTLVWFAALAMGVACGGKEIGTGGGGSSGSGSAGTAGGAGSAGSAGSTIGGSAGSGGSTLGGSAGSGGSVIGGNGGSSGGGQGPNGCFEVTGSGGAQICDYEDYPFARTCPTTSEAGLCPSSHLVGCCVSTSHVAGQFVTAASCFYGDQEASAAKEACTMSDEKWQTTAP
jgi:hypothetical protein